MPVAVAALLLTGGASRRMGVDKAGIMLEGESLAGRAARTLRTVADPVLEVGPGWTDLVRVDEGPARDGPLAAVAAGVAALPAGCAALVLAVDMPGVTADLLTVLARHPTPTTIVPADQEGRLQPLCARYSPAALAAAPDLVEAGRRSASSLLDAAPYLVLPAADWLAAAGGGTRADALADLDTPADLTRLAW